MKCVKPLLLPGSGITVRCGQCIGCRIRKKRDWAIRLVDEDKLHKESCFMTLTYDDSHLPKDNTLVKKHLQDFIKRLRRQLGKVKIRYFACGEYGEAKGRERPGKKQRFKVLENGERIPMNPHYHIIVFGKDLRDFNHPIPGKKGLYEAVKEVSENWSYGFQTVGGVTIDSCKYVANYVTKKYTGDKDWIYEEFNRIPEFSIMSRRPGIAAKFYEKYLLPRFIKGYGLQYVEEVDFKGFKVKIPKYYKDKNRDLKKLYGKQRVLDRDKNLEKSQEELEKIKKRENKFRDVYDIILAQNRQLERNLVAKEKLYG